MPENLLVLLLGLGGSAGVAALGALTAHRLRRGPLAGSSLIVPVTAVASVLAGLLAAAGAMFVSPHDLRVLLLVVVPAAAVSGGVALLLARRLARDVAAVPALAGDLSAPVGHLPAELVGLVAELRRGRADLEEGLARERALEAGRSALVAWVSHDLRTPLAGLRAMSEALEDGVVDDAASIARYHRRMRQDVDRLTAMVDDLLEMSLLQGAAGPPALSRVALSDIVADALAAAEPLALAQRVRLRGAVADADTPVLANAGAMARVLGNLIVNALRHTPAGGLVEVVTGDGDGSAWVEVADECGGIPAEDLPRLFEVAFRGQAARTPEPEGISPAGAGLGLAIAQGIIDTHGGLITVDNDGPGCRFRVRLPLAPGQPEPGRDGDAHGSRADVPLQAAPVA